MFTNNILSKLTLLYIDDEPSIRENAVEYFNRYFETVLEAADGAEGFQLYDRLKPDIIITDIKMPKLNGLELARKIRKNDKKIPIIILTAFTETQYLLDAVELQLIKYIIKPMTEAKLIPALQLAMDSLSHQNSNIKKLTDDLTYDTFNKSLFFTNIPIKLTKYERNLLDILIRNAPRTLSYTEIENYIWTDEGMNIDSLRTLIRSLRKKLGVDIIENISGLGYRITVLNHL